MSIFGGTSTAAATQWKYDVFLNFRGEDIRRTFLSHLREALCRAKLVTFLDENLRRGKEISPALRKAIEDSNVAVAIFTKDYATSPWCLEELAKIIECYQYKGQIVVPVFYDVRSKVVLEQSDIYAEAFAKHEKDPQNARYVPQWKAAMTKAANIAGISARSTRSESELVKEIVNEILIILGRTSDVMDGTVETGSGTPKSLSIKVARTRTVEIQVSGGLRMTKSEDLPVDHLVSLLEPLQHLSEASLQSLQNSNASLRGHPIKLDQYTENSNADSIYRRVHGRRPSGYAEESRIGGQNCSTALNNRTEIVLASAPTPKLTSYSEGSKNAGSGSSSAHISSSPTNSQFFLPAEEEKFVLYVTRSGVIKETLEDNDAVRKILGWLMMKMMKIVIEHSGFFKILLLAVMFLVAPS